MYFMYLATVRNIVADHCRSNGHLTSKKLAANIVFVQHGTLFCNSEPRCYRRCVDNLKDQPFHQFQIEVDNDSCFSDRIAYSAIDHSADIINVACIQKML